MTTHHKKIGDSLTVSGTMSADVRSSLTGQFLMAAAMQSRAAAIIESTDEVQVSEDDKVAHRGYVIGALMQATSALECEVWEVMSYGPGHHLGSNGIDCEARDFLAPIADTIDRRSVLERYQLVLHLLRKKCLDPGVQPWQDASLVVRLRNELVHYKSKWASELERSKLLRALQDKNHQKPPFIKGSANFFPHECLSAACASWGVQSIVAFFDAFYTHMGFPDRLNPYRARLRSTL
ncbi:MAG: hypothetical protein A2Z47_10765 [Thermodesulfovibrio sp. RBG_19FT_COMBO_42_12]|nr:MAG: hypothetical protein A2Z47_10765 [Thermodesulfovibrio sp. RBG_19FT_COMBO_42_12]